MEAAGAVVGVAGAVVDVGGGEERGRQEPAEVAVGDVAGAVVAVAAADGPVLVN